MRSVLALGLGVIVVGACGGIASSALAQTPPVIEHLEPTSGPPGVLLQIVGRGFTADAVIRLGTTSLTIERLSPSRIEARIGADAVTEVVSVETAAGRMRGPQFRVTAPLPPPTIEQLTPSSGPPGTELTIRGSGFAPGLSRTQVTLAGRPLVVRSASPTELRVIVPDAAVSGPIDVSVREGGSVRSGASFEVTARTEIESVEPRGVAPGQTVTITGTGFSPELKNDRVYLNNQPCTVLEASATRLRVTIPERATTGVLLVDVRGAGRAQSEAKLVVQRTPVLARVEPDKALAGARVTLHGEHFGSDASAIVAQLGDAPLTIEQADDTRVIVRLPAQAQSGEIRITVHGVGPAVSPEPFEILEPLALSTIDPRTGPVGSVITLAGAGFSPAARSNRVTMAGRALDVLHATAHELKVRVTPGASGPIQIQVSGGGETRSTDPFVVTTPPILVSHTPSKGTVGTEVTIRGARFGHDPLSIKVTLNDRAQEILSVRDDLLLVRIAPNAATGKLSVTSTLQGTATFDTTFTVVPALVLLRALPERAPAGTTVDVRGSGFESGAVVVLGEQTIEPESITPERLRFVVPAGAGGGLLTVRLRDGREATAPRAIVTQP